ncbi:YheC/YheD family protein [Paenibacillus turpanensis]|uniref:YheC/YheD family endospore coat-associated protein n=1 Tax=Paenibacillus turpanensis TaxID=2689078 RepID=UPI00140A8D74|nr:YheC/YheD family protein [Paenibacillus turpanensis]
MKVTRNIGKKLVRVRNGNEKPVVAILTYVDDSRVFRGDKQNYLDITRVGQENGVRIYILPTSQFSPYSSKLTGFEYDFSLKKWVKREVPFPNVVYNRIPYRKFEQLPEVQRVLSEIESHPQLRMFNPHFFNKWQLFEWLRQSEETKGLVPNTRKYKDAVTLGNMLKSHPSLYLKPVKGKAGKGIMRINRSISKGKTVYTLIVQEKEGTTRHHFGSISELTEQLEELKGNKDYIVQQAIKLAVHQTRPFDLRVLVQKDGKGLWRLTGVGARVAGASSITTHVPRGGSIDRPSKLLSGAFGAREGKRILAKTKSTALRIAKQIERSCGQPLGEMSMDLGVDRGGALWFFEANSKPMKFDEPKIRAKSLTRLVRYFAYLAKTTGR